MVIQPRVVAYNREFPPSKYEYCVHKTLNLLGHESLLQKYIIQTYKRWLS